MFYFLQVANDIDSYQGILEEINGKLGNSSKFYIAIIIIISVNLLAGILNYITCWSLQNREKGIHRANIRESNRISILENLHAQMEAMTLIDPQDIAALSRAVANFDRFIRENALYIDKGSRRLAQKFSDYFKDVTIDYLNKDYGIEDDFINQFIKLFHK